MAEEQGAHAPRSPGWRDGALRLFVLAMVLFHTAAAPGGVYLSLFLTRDLAAAPRDLSYAFVVSMVAWMLVVWPAGRLADRLGRKPLLLLGWAAQAVRMALIAAASAPWQVLGVQVLDGLSQGLFSVMAAAWVTDRFGDPRRVGQAQVLVGSALVFGSALGPTLAGLVVGPLGYRGMFWLLAGLGTVATLVLAVCVPETVATHREGPVSRPMAVVSDLADIP